LKNLLTYSGRTALHCASSQGHLPICILLLNNGADPTITVLKGSNALHVLAQVDLKALLSENSVSDIDKLQTKVTSSTEKSLKASREILDTFASTIDHSDLPAQVVQLMLDKGLDINAKDKKGDTPLMRACFKGWNYNFFMLLSKGAYAFYVNK
jgi:ankyrin repeat protein